MQRPLVNFYSSNFILWELSTPFLNIHWFMDKVNMTGSRPQLYNGIMLLYQSYRVLSDFWRGVGVSPSPDAQSLVSMVYTTDSTIVPFWAFMSYFLSNMVLNFLNFFWFFKMVRAVGKRFEPNPEPVTEAEINVSTVASGLASEKPRVTRRKA
jgi:TLC domain